MKPKRRTVTTERHLSAEYAKVIGRRIVSVETHAFATDFVDGEDGGSRGGEMTSDPRFILDDGSVLSFVVDETEIGEYGLHPVVCSPKRRRKARP